MAKTMLDRFRRTRHENIMSAEEFYVKNSIGYALVDDLPLTLAGVVGCVLYPTENQLASIMVQVNYSCEADADDI